MGAVVTVRFETLDEFVREVIEEGMVDGEVVRAQVEQQQVNDGLALLHIRCGFLSDGQLREVIVPVGELPKGGTLDLTVAKECVAKLKEACEDRGLSVREGRFELVVT